MADSRVDQYEFPSTWRTGRLEDVCHQMKQGQILSQREIQVSGKYPVFGANGCIGFSDSYLLEDPHVLITCRGSTCGRINLAPAKSFVTNNSMILFEKDLLDKEFLFYALQEFSTGGLKTGSGQPQLTKGILSSHEIPLPPRPEQKNIAHILSTVQRAIEEQARIIQTTTELKKALMQKLFTEGFRGEPQKETEIGLVPESWEVVPVESVCAIKSTAMTYQQLEYASDCPNGVRVLGVKVSDMNLPGNETEFISANLERQLSQTEAAKRTIPENSIVFPKRGAAIATNKKRVTTCWTVLDPNLIAVIPNEEMNHKYLCHWFNTFDLTKITDPGPTPQLNRKDIAPLKFPKPLIEEQDEIARAIEGVDAKLSLHERKKAMLQNLFRTLLHDLMTASTRVDELDFPFLDEVA